LGRLEGAGSVRCCREKRRPPCKVVAAIRATTIALDAILAGGWPMKLPAGGGLTECCIGALSGSRACGCGTTGLR
jgi:hypothetical protein